MRGRRRRRGKNSSHDGNNFCCERDHARMRARAREKGRRRDWGRREERRGEESGGTEGGI